MKVTTEKLPKSLLALDIELDRAQVEKGLDRAARRISQKYAIPGFRKGKAPRFIVENYFGREALLEEASEDLVQRTFREALTQEQITPVGQAQLELVNLREEPFRLRIQVPVAPTVTLPDYRAIHVPYTATDVTDEMLEQALEERREKHVVLRVPEEARPAQAGDELTVKLQSFVDGKPLDELDGQDAADDEDDELAELDELDDDELDELDELDDDDDDDDDDTDIDDDADDAAPARAVSESQLVLEPKRLVPGLFEGLVGIAPGETREVIVKMPEDHANEKVRGKDVTFKVELVSLQERLLPEWDELPVLEEYEGTLDQLRTKTREDLVESISSEQKRDVVNQYVEQLVEQSEFDIPDALVEQEADRLLHEQGAQFERYGITLEQMLQYRGQTHDQAVQALLPDGEQRLKTTLALQDVARAEGLVVEEHEVDAEIDRAVGTYKEEEREMARALLSTQLRNRVGGMVLNQKLNERLFEIATGTAPALAVDDAPASPPLEPTEDQE